MKNANLLRALLFSAIALIPTTPRADDIDLYTGGEQQTGAPVNVLFVLDNSTNWAAANQGWTDGGKQGQAELTSMTEVIGRLSDNVNVGLLLAAGSNGGYVRYAVREMNLTNRTVFQDLMSTMATTFGGDGNNDDKVNTSSIVYDSMMNASYRYFSGLNRFGVTDLPSGSATDLRDFAGNVNHQANTAGLGGYSLAGASTNPYLPPGQASTGCAKNFIIFIGNGYPNQAGSKQDLTDVASLVGITDATITNDVVGGDNAKVADEWARFMKNYGVLTAIDDPKSTTTPRAKLRNSITTYTLDVCKDQCETSQELLLRSMAAQGGGKYFKTTSRSEINSALALIFAEIQAINSVFASATLPVSVNTQGTYENQVYIGVFRPDQGSRPRWYGNLKEYQFARYCDANNNDLVDNIGASGDERIDGAATPASCSGDTLKLFLADRNNLPAVDQSLSTGFLDFSATSFWTSPSTYWTFLPSDPAGTSDSPDGPNVERGGAAQRLRAQWAATPATGHPDGRKLFTCLGPCIATGASAANRLLSNNIFAESNASVATALTPPSGTMTASSIYRAWNTVVVNFSSPHGIGTVGTTYTGGVTIAGATPDVYNGLKPAVFIRDLYRIEYPVTETPASTSSWTAIPGRMSTPGSPISGLTITLASTTPGTTVTASLSSPILTTNQSLRISGAATPSLNAEFIATSNNTFQVTLPPLPGSSSVHGTSRTTSQTANNVAVVYSATDGVVTVTATSNLGNQFQSGASVALSGVTPDAYNGTYTITSTGTGCPGGVKNVSFCFSKSFNASSPDVGTVTPASGPEKVVSLFRESYTPVIPSDVEYSQYLWLYDNSGHGLSAGNQVIITGAPSGYNGQWPVWYIYDTVWARIGPITLSPAQPSGSVTASLGSGGPSRANLVSWVRGKDVVDDENLNGLKTDVRASVHGDVLHSRPLLINYGGTIGIVGFYGSNDGYLRAVKGGGDATDGAEKWAFLPEEFVDYSRLSRLYSNQSVIRFPNMQCGITPDPLPRNYMWDGQLTAYQSANKVSYTVDGVTYERPEKTYLYVGMRRGGRALYAIDISDPDTPSFLWRINQSSPGFSQLGYTWSEPKLAKIKGMSGSPAALTEKTVLIFGAGYDPEDDDKPAGSVRGDRSGGYGHGVFIVDALTGELVNLVQPSGVRRYSFPADITLLDPDGDGVVDRIYAVDSGAQVFRFDAVQTSVLTDANAWTPYALANLGDTDANGGSDARKFLFPPEVLPFVYDSNLAYMILVGSGDREKPLPNKRRNSTTQALEQNTLTCSTYAGDASSSAYSAGYYGPGVQDRFYGVVDKIATGTDPATVSPITEASLSEINGASNGSVGSYNICYSFRINCDGDPPVAANPTKMGWYVTLKNDTDGDTLPDEEKLVNAPRVVSGLVLFGTNTPQLPDTSRGVCSNLGEARAYAVNPFTGAPSFDRDGDGDYDQNDYAAEVVGGGLPPTVTSGVVGIDGSFYRFVIGAGGTGTVSASPIAGARNPISLRGVRSRVFWYYQTDEK